MSPQLYAIYRTHAQTPESSKDILSNHVAKETGLVPGSSVEAVLDTGCQRSAIGSRTLSCIANALPEGLHIQY